MMMKETCERCGKVLEREGNFSEGIEVGESYFKGIVCEVCYDDLT
jgi:hypothetical protein